MNRVYEGVHQGNCGHVTPGKGSDVGYECGDCVHITPSAGGEGGSPWKLRVCDPRSMVREGFIMETMDVKFQV